MKSTPILKRLGTSSPGAVLRGLSAVMVLSFFVFFVPMPAHGQGQPLLTHHMREAVSSGQVPWLGHLPATQSLKLAIALPLRNESELHQVLQLLYAPGSPMYHKFLSVEEFTGRFGPSQEDYDAVIGFAQASGLTVTGTAPNRLIVDVAGPVSNIEAAFNVNMGVYQHPTENRTFYAPDREPTADLPFALWHISGLDNFSIPRPAAQRSAAGAKSAPAGTGSGPGGAFLGSDMRAAYYGNGTLTGTGQSVGLFEESPYNISDVNTYFSNVGQTRNVPVNPVSLNGVTATCTGNCGEDTGEPEVVLDIIEAISMAPGMTQVRVYVGSSDASIFNSMATDGNTNNVKSLSCSWGWEPADPGSDEPYFEEFAAQGQSLFVASGDGGAYPDPLPNGWPWYYPSESANVTAVGGTDLTTGTGQAWVSETAWSDSGGGIAQDTSTGYFGIPTWQQTAGVVTTANKGSKTYRNVPDVAAEANFDNYICYWGGTCAGDWGGTSFAAPRWAGYIALVNQQSMAETQTTAGFINPAIYTIGLSSSYTANFHDITIGNNDHNGIGYSAETGYDLVTGWGSPNGAALITSLTSGPGGSWTPVSYSYNPVVGTGQTSTLLWAGTGGYAYLWTLGSTNNFKSLVTYGPYGGWTPVSYTYNPAGSTSTLLWAGPGGYASIWTLNSSNNSQTSQVIYGPYGGWTPVSYSYNPAGSTSTLVWEGSGGYACLWTLNSSNNSQTSQVIYGPYGGWAPVSYAYNPAGSTSTLLWSGPGGYAAIYTLNSSNNSFSTQALYPESGWTPVSYSYNSGETTSTLLWGATGGYASIWTLDSSNNSDTTNVTYGP
ncbi:MAG: protease pro-enzyme activation domain-containing protein [Syntrophobacteraceae bacterium]